MPGVTVNGNDAEAMWLAARNAVARARAGDGPTLIEAKTFRFLGHVLGDDNSYMKEGELAAAMENDPIPRLRGLLIERGVADAELLVIEAEIDAEIEEAVAFALDSGISSVDELRIDVFAQEIAA
jgi:pyruvate dehydrogenase E1 component alpha subunit